MKPKLWLIVICLALWILGIASVCRGEDKGFYFTDAQQIENAFPHFILNYKSPKDAYVEMWLDDNTKQFNIECHNCSMTEGAKIFMEYIKNNWLPFVAKEHKDEKACPNNGIFPAHFGGNPE